MQRHFWCFSHTDFLLRFTIQTSVSRGHPSFLSASPLGQSLLSPSFPEAEPEECCSHVMCVEILTEQFVFGMHWNLVLWALQRARSRSGENVCVCVCVNEETDSKKSQKWLNSFQSEKWNLEKGCIMCEKKARLGRSNSSGNLSEQTNDCNQLPVGGNRWKRSKSPGDDDARVETRGY